MKQFNVLILLALFAAFTSCSDDDDSDITSANSQVVLKFDNGVEDQDFIFNTSYERSNGESFQLKTLKYIISNIRLKNANGDVFEFPEDDNIFIVDEEDANNAGEVWITMEDIPTGSYDEITFGVGVDQERYRRGAEGQGPFFEVAEVEGMTWDWAAGYKFTRFDGIFSNDTISEDALSIHMGSLGTTTDNYRETTIALPNSIIVESGKVPEIHIKVDIMKVFDGVTSITFADGFNLIHTSKEKTPIIADNMITGFTVHHTHND